jgi:predicted RNase H-like nuclease (RuvC/YqgF family)
MPFAEVPQWLTNIGSAIAGLGVGGYTIHRVFKRDANSDQIDDKGQRLIDSLSRQIDLERNAHAAQLKYERDNSARLGLTIDRLSEERNEAVKTVGRLEGQVQALQASVEHLQAEVRKLEAIISSLIDEVREFRRAMAAKFSAQGGSSDRS